MLRREGTLTLFMPGLWGTYHLRKAQISESGQFAVVHFETSTNPNPRFAQWNAPLCVKRLCRLPLALLALAGAGKTYEAPSCRRPSLLIARVTLGTVRLPQ
jgi:hypothetical protein